MPDDRTRNAMPYGNPIPTADYAPAPTRDPDSTQPPSRPPGPPPAELPEVPGYEVTGEIARGGMGRVLAARDLALDRPVAVKVVLPGHGPAAAVRFVREARITGRLTHPGIPPAHHLGRLADGSPFLAMKLVRGDTLADLLNARPAPAHDLPRFVGVFEQVCQAVGFAHSQGVVHRDLKPANVMVGAFGEVQVMDWGLARSSEERGVWSAETGAGSPRPPTPSSSLLTAAGAVMGTPAYMAPEQARGEDVDARADVFALGVVLFEIVTGARPFAGETGSEVLARAAAADLAPAIGRLDRCGVDPALVTLAKQCLASDPAARPADAAAVAGLVGAFHAGVEERLRRAEQDRAAAEATAAEQRKRRRVVAAAAAVVLTAVTAGAGVAAWQAVRATAAERQAGVDRDTARREAAAATAAKTFLQRVLTQATTYGPSSYVRQPDPNVTLATALVRAAGQVGGAFPDQPRIEADLRQTIGIALVGLGRYAEAEPHLAAALALHDRELGPDAPAALTSAYYLGEVYLFTARPGESEPLLRRALDGRTRVLGPAHPDTFDAVNDVALLCFTTGRLAEAEALLEPAVAGATAAVGPDHPATLFVTGALGQLRVEQGRPTDAAPLLERSLAGRERVFGPDHPDTHDAVCTLGNLRLAQGRPAEGRELYERALAGFEKGVGPNHPYVGACLTYLARAYAAEGRPEDVGRCYRRSLAITEAVHGRDAPVSLAEVTNLAVWLAGQNRPGEAEPLHVRAVEVAHRHHGPLHPTTLVTESNLAATYTALGRTDDARALLRGVLAARERALPADHPDTLATIRALATAEMKAERHAAAEPLWRRYLAAAEGANLSALDAATARFRLGEVLFAQRRFDEAGPHLDRGFRESAAAGMPRDALHDAAARLAFGYGIVNRFNDAIRWAGERAKYLETAPPPRAAGQ